MLNVAYQLAKIARRLDAIERRLDQREDRPTEAPEWASIGDILRAANAHNIPYEVLPLHPRGVRVWLGIPLWVALPDGSWSHSPRSFIRFDEDGSPPMYERSDGCVVEGLRRTEVDMFMQGVALWIATEKDR